MDSLNRVSRREALAGIVTASAVGIAGCSGDDGNSNAPDSDANPEDLLPEPPEGWEIDGEAQQQAAGMIGAESGFEQSYNNPDGNRYSVGIYRFASQSDAEDADPFWTVFTVSGNFAFAGRGPDVDNVFLLLGNSSGLTEEYARNNNKI